MRLKGLFIGVCVAVLFTNCSKSVKENPLFDNSTIASTCVIKSDTSIVILRDFFPKLKKIDKVYSNDIKINLLSKSGQMDTIMMIVNENTPFLSVLGVQSEGQVASIIVEKRIDGEKVKNGVPFVGTMSSHRWSKSFSVRSLNAPANYFVFWQNNLLPPKFIKYDKEGAFRVFIPENANKMERSFIRIFVSNKNGIGNDVLVPLNYGKVINDSKSLKRGDKQNQIIYSLLIDRFYNGNKANDWKIDNPELVNPKVDYWGGDLAGITQKIEEGYFDELGINTLWISPITQNPYDAWGEYPNPKTKFSGYHGYWPIYITKLDDRFGTPDELRELLDVAHKGEKNVILDYVAHHAHINSPTLKEHPDWITPSVTPDGRPNFELWDEFRLTTWFDKHIPSFDLEKEYINEPLTDSALYWMKNYEFDGFRHDATKHIPENFWRKLTRKLLDSLPDRDLYQIGETYGSPSLIGSYVRSGMLDGQFDFNLYDSYIYATSEKNGSFKALSETIEESLNTYGYHNLMGYITGNHDRPRYVSLVGGDLILGEDYKDAGWLRNIGITDSTAYNKLFLLHTLIFTLPGIPCVYYGDEYGQPGANDPDNRRWAQFEPKNSREKEVFENLCKLSHLRKKSMPLLYGDYYELIKEDDLIAYIRIYMGDYELVVLNKGETPFSKKITLPLGLLYKNKTEVMLEVEPLSSLIISSDTN